MHVYIIFTTTLLQPLTFTLLQSRGKSDKNEHKKVFEMKVGHVDNKFYLT